MRPVLVSDLVESGPHAAPKRTERGHTEAGLEPEDLTALDRALALITMPDLFGAGDKHQHGFVDYRIIDIPRSSPVQAARRQPARCGGAATIAHGGGNGRSQTPTASERLPEMRLSSTAGRPIVARQRAEPPLL